MDNRSFKSLTLDLVRESHAIHQGFVAGLTDAQRAEIGTYAHWSAKDVLAHVTFWQECQYQRLEAARRGETPPKFADVERLNKETFDVRHERSWTDVIADSERAFMVLTEATQGFSEAELSEPKHFAWQDTDAALWTSINGTANEHPVVHFVDYYIEHGDQARAIAMQEAHVVAMQKTGIPTLHGYALYNLACFYAKTGQTAKAIAALPEALRLVPDVMEWSKEDPDLVSLHTEPGYQALYSPVSPSH